MQGKMIVIRVDGTIEATEIVKQPKLEELQAAVGGYLEGVPLLDTYEGADCIAYCNEEGKLKRLPMNVKASRAWNDALTAKGHSMHDVLVGDVVIITGDDELLADA